MPKWPSLTESLPWTSSLPMWRPTCPQTPRDQRLCLSWPGVTTLNFTQQEDLTWCWERTLFTWRTHLCRCCRLWSTCAQRPALCYWPVRSATSEIQTFWACSSSGLELKRSTMRNKGTSIYIKLGNCHQGGTCDCLLICNNVLFCIRIKENIFNSPKITRNTFITSCQKCNIWIALT